MKIPTSRDIQIPHLSINQDEGKVKIGCIIKKYIEALFIASDSTLYINDNSWPIGLKALNKTQVMV